ncbi:glycosyltransferase family 2 protein [Azospirillum canadense]|uniref:glycosyltransferase family 2 protein n=1 Tax=Azospirillum canadense TaxID=403962 RepID=UPI0022277A47|nr:glycosyltransferase family 2 protein [Azospirillum canadense]MCW2240905.1 glycosyltransferase involved in cell wall biosynthesis [Azospirillum canadense]
MQLISVVIPAHNAATTIARALDSIFAQGYDALDIIVVDDCSTDATTAVVERYAGRGVRLISLKPGRGAAGARNAGIGAARGDLIAFLDADDEWLPGKLHKQVAELAKRPRTILVSCRSSLIAPNGANLGNVYGSLKPATGIDAWRTLLAYNFITTPSVLTYREALRDAGCFNPALKVAEDQDMWLKLAMKGEVAYVDECLVLVHMMPNSLSSGDNVTDQLTYTLPMIMQHLRTRQSDLPRREYNRIIGRRLGHVGRQACGRGMYRVGITLTLRSVLAGYEPVGGLLFLAKSLPPMRWLKNWMVKMPIRRASSAHQ